MRITSKGQVTIPREIRDRLGLLPETDVEFEVEGNAVRIRKATDRTTRGQRVIAQLRGRVASRRSTDEIMAFTRPEPKRKRRTR